MYVEQRDIEQGMYIELYMPEDASAWIPEVADPVALCYGLFWRSCLYCVRAR
jgi:hypothetical protein